MTQVNIDEFAASIGVETERLLKQLKDAGVEIDQEAKSITTEQKLLLLQKLEQDHGTQDKSPAMKKISLKRKTTREIKVTRASGARSMVSVVRKRRKVYDPNAEQAKEPKPEDTTASEQLTEEQTVLETQAKTAEQATQTTAEKIPVPPEKKSKKEELAKSAEVASHGEDKSTKKPSKGRAKETISKKDVDQEKPRKKGKMKNIGGEDLENLRVRRRARVKPKRHEEEGSKKHGFEMPTAPQVHEVKIPETISVAELAQKISIKAAEVIKVMIKMGVMATINQVIDQDTAVLVVEEMGHKAIALEGNTIESSIEHDHHDDEEGKITRSPIITVMGHVDHGKTSLLDKIRQTQVTHKEAGGITQHIGAYHVVLPKGEMTFLDTPGHAAFTSMRARGANCTDIVVLVVAADDGVKPQTLEAISHAKAAKVPILVAVNKMDKPDADIERVKNELSQHELIPEDWGGDIMFLPVSAHSGQGIEELLESLLLVAEVQELKAVPEGPAKGTVVEARLDKGRGPVATLLVQSGCLKQGDIVLAGLEYGRVRLMVNENGQALKQAGPSFPAEIIGLSGTPMAGDPFVVVANERKAREVAMHRQAQNREVKLARQQASKLEGMFERMQQSDQKTLNIVLKTDVQGSAEALKEALEDLSTEEVKVSLVSIGIGGINESDVSLAMASSGLLIGFNVRADALARKLANAEGIALHYYSVIYDVIDAIKAAVVGLVGPKFEEKIIGVAKVKDVFRSSKYGTIAGCMVEEGMIKRGNPIRVLRDNVVIHEGALESLRRFKDDANEVKHGNECGIGLKNFNDFKTNDSIEVYERVEVPCEALG